MTPFRSTRTLLCAFALLGLPTAGFATPIPAPSLTVDELIGQASLPNSGDETELAALRTLTGIGNLVLGSKIEVDGGHGAAPAIGLASAWVLRDTAQPGYFALKFGTGSTWASADTFFFRNIGDLAQLVWTNDQVQFLSGGDCAPNPDKCKIDRLSHYTTAPALVATDAGLEGASQEGQVPEPGSIALLAAGALAVCGARPASRRLRPAPAKPDPKSSIAVDKP